MIQEIDTWRRDELRAYVLDALDAWARERCGHYEYVRGITGAGWKDADLPELFKTLDAHYQKLIDRFEDGQLDAGIINRTGTM